MTTVYFVRHAEPVHSWVDDRTRPLSAEGLADRARVLEYFNGKRIDIFISSPYRRSLQTIEPTASHFRQIILTDERLKERISGPDSMKNGNLHRRWSDFDYCEASGESIRSVQSRNIQALEAILQANLGKTIVIGTHGTSLSSVINYYDPEFGVDDFIRIMGFMPYIFRLNFDRMKFVNKEEVLYLAKEMPNLK